MKSGFEIIPFLFIAMCLCAYSFAQELPEIVIEDADATTTINLVAPPSDLFDASEVDLRLPNEAVICRADEKMTIDLAPPPDDLFDASEVDLRLPNEAAVCRADEVVVIDLIAPPEEFFDPAPEVKILSRTPVLFVPGLLSTEIRNNEDLLWLDLEKVFWSTPDDFLDDLSFQNDLTPYNDALSLGQVIKTKIIPFYWDYDYSQGLMDEFAGQGYDVNEDSGEQTFYTFPYDWRYGASGVYPKPENTSQRDITNSDLLAERIGQLAAISPMGKVDVIAHSLGGLIVKKYVAQISEPKINKLVFVGVPNLGAPLAGRALIHGTDFGVFGLNPQELKKISQNMPAAYDLLPSQAYFSAKGAWLSKVKPTTVFGINQTNEQDYVQTRIYLAGVGLNGAATQNAIDFHSEFDAMLAEDFLAKEIDSYNIVGCKSATFSNLQDWVNPDGTHNHYDFFDIANGDDTVPFESANRRLASDANTLYAPAVKHGQMPSFDGIRQKIVGIISGNNIAVPNGKIVARVQLLADNNLCRLWGTAIKIESPLAIKITDQFGNIIEDVAGIGPKNEIPGAAFEIDGAKKFVYLPQDTGEQYQIDLQGTGDGLFTLTTQAVKNDILQTPRVFGNIPVGFETRGILEIGDQETILKINAGGNGPIDQTFSQDDNLSVDELTEDFDRYVDQGLIKKPQSKIWGGALRSIKSLLAVWQKNKNKESGKSSLALARAANERIDSLIAQIGEVQGADAKTSRLLINSLERLKLK